MHLLQKACLASGRGAASFSTDDSQLTSVVKLALAPGDCNAIGMRASCWPATMPITVATGSIRLAGQLLSIPQHDVGASHESSHQIPLDPGEDQAHIVFAGI